LRREPAAPLPGGRPPAAKLVGGTGRGAAGSLQGPLRKINLFLFTYRSLSPPCRAVGPLPLPCRAAVPLPPGRGPAGSGLRPVGHFLARAMMLLRFLACAIAREDEPVETKTRPHASTKTANQRVLLPGRGRCNRCRGSCRLGQWRPGNIHDADRVEKLGSCCFSLGLRLIHRRRELERHKARHACLTIT